MREGSGQNKARKNDLSLLNGKLVKERPLNAPPCIVSEGQLSNSHNEAIFKQEQHGSMRTEINIDLGVDDFLSYVPEHGSNVVEAPSKTGAFPHSDFPQDSFVTGIKHDAQKSSSSFENQDRFNSREMGSNICNTDHNEHENDVKFAVSLQKSKIKIGNVETKLAAFNQTDSYTLMRMLRLQRCFEENMDELYDFCSLYASEWPLLTIEWIPALSISDPSCDYTLKYLAVGTQAAKGIPNQVQLMEVAVPDAHIIDDPDNQLNDPDTRSVADRGNQFQHVRGHCCFQKVIISDSPVLKIRAAPKDTHIIAVKTGGEFIGVYNLSQDESTGGREHNFQKTVLRGHRTGGFGLSWNPVRPGVIASGGDDCYVNYWDIRHTVDCNAEHSAIQVQSVLPDATGDDDWPVYTFIGHRDIVTDVSWHASEGHLLVSSSLDGDVRFWDTRFGAHPMTLVGVHKQGVTAAQFHPTGVFQLVTAGVGGEVSFWDTRWPKEAFTTICYHNKCVTGLQWSPFSKTIMGSFGEDGQAVIWDLDKSLLPPSYSENDMAPPEVAFAHIGHLGSITDLSWCPEESDAWMMASTDVLNGVHIYKPKMSVLRDYVATL